MRYVLMLLTVGQDDDLEEKEEVADRVRALLSGDFLVVSTSELRNFWS